MNKKEHGRPWKRLIFYDLDGTLVDTRRDIAAATNHMLHEFGKPTLSVREVSPFVGRGLHHLVKSCLGAADNSTVEKGAAIYRAFYSEHMLDHSRLYPGVKKILNYFKSQKQIVLTNKPNPFSRRLLESLGVAHYFAEIIAGNSSYPKKPDPAAILAIMKREKILREEALFIGDSLIDIETARRAGIQEAVVTHGFTEEDELQSAAPDFLVKDFNELLRGIRTRAASGNLKQ